MLSVLLIIVSLISIQINVNAHSGKTDSSGGHKDNKNKSGLGSYHYHCGGHPAHLHTNGVCPYSSSSATTSTSTPTSTTVTTPATIDATEIKINETINSIEVGKSKKLTATITPSNTTDKNITWKSSDESIATISSSGKITTKREGNVEITASTSNGKTSTIKINVKGEKKLENTVTSNTSKITNNNQGDSNPFGGILALGILGGGGYWSYKKYKKIMLNREEK